MEAFVLAFAATGTAFATGVGAIPVSHLGAHAARLRPALWGLSAGLMGVAAILGLLLPALDEGSLGAVVLGLGTGLIFLLVSRRALGRHDVHLAGLSGAGVRRSALVFVVLLVHSLPEGFAIGTAYASSTQGLGLYVILAIALQNVPEGTTVALPMEAAGFTRRQQFWAAVLTSAPQPVGALIAYVLVTRITALLPFSFGFAAGAMLALVAIEILPQAAARGGRTLATAGAATGAALMVVLAALLGV
jgi:ZIP family zinc transporter